MDLQTLIWGSSNTLVIYGPYVLLFLRVVIGLNFLAGRGIPQLFTERKKYIEEWSDRGVLAPIVFSVAVLNFFGAILLIVGFIVPIVSALFIVEMVATAYFRKYKLKHVYFGHGRPSYELNVSYLLFFLSLLILGEGAFSVGSTVGL